MVGGKLPVWRLEQAEKASATSVFEDFGADDEDGLATGGSSADDCLRLRLTIVRALLRCHRDADAASAAESSAQIHPQSAAALLWHGRCLLRSGQRTEGLRKLSNGLIRNVIAKQGSLMHQQSADFLCLLANSH